MGRFKSLQNYSREKYNSVVLIFIVTDVAPPEIWCRSSNCNIAL